MAKPNKFAAMKEATKNRPHATLDDFLLDNSGDGTTVIGSMVIRLPADKFYSIKQVRTDFDEHSINELAQTFQTHGQLQPIRVYPPDSDGRYRIYNGERRWRAAKLIDGFLLEAVVDIRATLASQILQISGQLVENDQREPLSLMDTAVTLSEMMALCGSQEMVARTLGWYVKDNLEKPNINRVSKILGILKLPPEGLKLVSERVLNDLTIIELLRKISELDIELFNDFAEQARVQPLSRSNLDSTYKRLQKKESSTPAVKPEPQHQAGTAITDTGLSNSAPQFSPGRIEVNGRLNQPDTQEKGELEHESTSWILPQPVISVDLQNLSHGEIDFDREPQREGQVWIKLSTGDYVSAEYAEVKITSIAYINCSHRQLLAQKSNLVAHIHAIANAKTPDDLASKIELALVDTQKL